MGECFSICCKSTVCGEKYRILRDDGSHAAVRKVYLKERNGCFYEEYEVVFTGRGWNWNRGNYIDSGDFADDRSDIPQSDYVDYQYCL